MLGWADICQVFRYMRHLFPHLPGTSFHRVLLSTLTPAYATPPAVTSRIFERTGRPPRNLNFIYSGDRSHAQHRNYDSRLCGRDDEIHAAHIALAQPATAAIINPRWKRSLSISPLDADVASSAAITADADAVPNERMSVFSPLAAPLCLTGTEFMISRGIAAKPIPIPDPTKRLTTKICHT
jgi:hypothetical protein